VITDPLATMQAALIALSNGEATEIEMAWSVPVNGEFVESLTITVRREVTATNEGEVE
jgi:hypothetical protein